MSVDQISRVHKVHHGKCRAVGPLDNRTMVGGHALRALAFAKLRLGPACPAGHSGGVLIRDP